MITGNTIYNQKTESGQNSQRRLRYCYFFILFHCCLVSLNNTSNNRIQQMIEWPKSYWVGFSRCGVFLHHLCTITCGVPQGQVPTPLLIQKTFPPGAPSQRAWQQISYSNIIWISTILLKKNNKIAALKPASVERSCAHFSSFVEVNAKELECCFINQKAEPGCGSPFQQEL